MLERSREWLYKNDKYIRFSAAFFTSAALCVYLASRPTPEQTQFKGYLPIPTPRPILGFPPIPLNPRLDVSALCLPPENINGKVRPYRIRLSIKGIDIDTGPEGVWTVVKNLNTGQSAITSYTGNNRTAIYSGETHEGFINPIRWPEGEYKRPWIYSGAPYGIEIVEGTYTERAPNLGKAVAGKNIITPSCPQ